MTTEAAAVAPLVSERFGGLARVSSQGPIGALRTIDEATIEVAVGGAVQKLTVANANAIASGLLAAIDHIRSENPALLAGHEPSASEVALVLKALGWSRIWQAEGRSLDDITDSAVEKSMLLRRLRSGRPAMKMAPPTSFGQPWYDVLEADKAKVHPVACDGKLTTLAELLGNLNASATARNQFLVQVNGCHWNVLKTVEFGARYIVYYQGHVSHLFELAKGGDGSWSLRRFEKPAG